MNELRYRSDSRFGQSSDWAKFGFQPEFGVIRALRPIVLFSLQ